MLRIYFLQQWFNLSDPAVEEALYDSVVMRQFAGIDLGSEPVPDENHGLQVPPFAGRAPPGRADAGDGELAVAEQGGADHDGKVVVDEESSAKNREQKRDPGMHQTKKASSGTSG